MPAGLFPAVNLFRSVPVERSITDRLEENEFAV